MATEATVVLVPGFMQPAEAWSAVAELLPERYPSMLLRHREHDLDGRLAEIAAAAPARAVLCGYSLGGRLALNAAVRDPSAWAALVTVGATAGIEDTAERAARAQADARLASWIEGQPIDAVVSMWERQPLFADQSDALVEAQRPGRLAQDPRELARLLRSAGQGAMEPIWGRLHSLTLPTLAISGAIDERYGEHAARIARTVQNGRAAVVEHAGHAPQLQRPEAVGALLVEFLDEHLG